jgi:hypothetical protein
MILKDYGRKGSVVKIILVLSLDVLGSKTDGKLPVMK